ncbi:MAG: hypothetical protein J0L93_00740 [Deltaproteobacteria bacterium]|nr:hypothetical protein [Deltaproteobacteria bacterium]
MSKLKGLKGSILGLETYSYLVSLGKGGCGFYGTRKLKPHDLKATIVCQFEWNDVFFEPIKVEGEIIYSEPKDLDHATLFYTGVRFNEDQQFLVELLIQELEQMAEHGVIEKFLK